MLRALEERTRLSGAPGIADLFPGKVYPLGVVSAGQDLRLADGRSAMLYVSRPALAFSEQLARLSAEGGPVFGLIDPSHRVVARSAPIEETTFADAPDLLLRFREAGVSGASLSVPGLEVMAVPETPGTTL